MDTEARNETLAKMSACVLGDTEMTMDAAESVSEAIKQAYEAGYRACRDNAIRILAAKGEHDYE